MKQSVNALARPLVERLIAQGESLAVQTRRHDSGATLVDAGLTASSSVEAGVLIAEICMGGLGHVALRSAGSASGWPNWIEVRSAAPVLACLGSQYAGWSLAASKAETGGSKFFALGSGPGRALAAKEPLFAEMDYRDSADTGVLVLEVDREPPQFIVDKLVRDCGLAADALTLIVTPTSSRAGTTQVVARVLETALHKAHVLGFPLNRIVEGVGTAPLPVPSPDGVQAMGRTNDAILYGGQVHLSVRGDDDAARDLARRLPSRESPQHGQSFAEIFTAAGFDFYKIDPALFAPAEVWVSNLDSGNTWHAGGLEMALLRRLWSAEA